MPAAVPGLPSRHRRASEQRAARAVDLKTRETVFAGRERFLPTPLAPEQAERSDVTVRSRE